MHGSTTSGTHECEVQTAGVVVEDLVGGHGGVEEGVEDEWQLSSVAGKERGRMVGGWEVGEGVVEGGDGDESGGIVGANDLLQRGERDGCGRFGGPGPGARGHVFLLGGLVECSVGEEGIWCWHTDVRIVVVEIDHGVVLEVVADAGKILANRNVE